MTAARRIPIQIDPFFMLMITFLSLYNGQFVPLNAFLWSIVILISVLLHEFGHALTALIYGQRPSIHLVAFGGLTKRVGPRLKPMQEFILVLNGPLVSLLLAVCAGMLHHFFSPSFPPALNYLLEITIYANIFWTFLNLLPIQPLDGGQLLRIVLTSIFGVKGIKISLFLSFIFSLAIALLFFIKDQLLIGSLFLLFTFEGFRSWQQSLPLADQDEDVSLLRLVRNGEKEYNHGDLDAALQRFQAVREETSHGVLHLKATARMAEILNIQEEYQAAYDLLAPISNKLQIPEQMLLQELCMHLQRWKEAISIGNTIYKYHPNLEVAMANALAHASLGEVAPTIGWIQCAASDKNANLQKLFKKTEFDSIRHDPRFKELEKQFG